MSDGFALLTFTIKGILLVVYVSLFGEMQEITGLDVGIRGTKGGNMFADTKLTNNVLTTIETNRTIMKVTAKSFFLLITINLTCALLP